MAYRDWFPSILPAWFRRTWGGRYAGEIGGRYDEIVNHIRQGVLARYPGAIRREPGGAKAIAPTDALDRIGQERRLPRYPSESDSAYSARLEDAYTAWAGDDTPVTGDGAPAGAHFALLKQLSAAGFPTGSTGATIVQWNGWYAQLDGSGNLVFGASNTLMGCLSRVNKVGVRDNHPGWMFDSADKHWSSFGLVFPADVVSLTSGSTQHAVLNQIANTWRPAIALYRGCWILVAGKMLGWPLTSNTLGTVGNLGGATVRYLTPY